MNPTKQPKPDDRSRVYRGGSWYNPSASVVRAACRYGFTPTLRDNLLGFRTAQTGCRQPILKVQP